MPLLLAVSPDGSQLAVYTREHGVEVVNLWTDAESKKMAANNLTRLTHLEFKSTGDELIGLTESNQVIRWSLDDGEVFATRDVPKFSGPIALAADAELAVGLDDSDGLVVWDFARQVVRSTLEAGGEPIACVAVSRTGRYVAAAAIAEPEQVRLWDASAGHCLRTLHVDGQTKDSLRFTEDDESLIVTDVGGVVTIWQVATGAPLGRVEVPESARQTFAVDARGEEIAMQQPDGTIALSDIESEFGRRAQFFAMAAEPGAGAEEEVGSGEFDDVAEALPADEPIVSTALPETVEAQPNVVEGAGPVEPSQPDGGYTFVPVFFGTNRLSGDVGTRMDLFWGFFFSWLAFGVYAVFAVALLVTSLLYGRRAGRAVLGITLVLLLVLAVTYTQVKLSGAFATLGDEYGAETGPLQYGRCLVSVPPIHVAGELESPVTIWVYRGRERPDKHIMIQTLTTLDADEFSRQLNLELDQSPRKDAFVFIHGYNVGFRDAMRRTAQLAVDLDFRGPALCYSWPSHADPLRYLFDETNAAASAARLRDFLRHVTETTSAERIHVIAHSMGNRVLAAALQLLPREDLHRLGYIVLAAPDIDRREFLDPIAPAIAADPLHVTLYASSNDNALWLSKRFHDFQRAGDTMPELTICDGVETIDASIVDTSLLGHSYYGDRPTMLKDLAALIIGNKRAAVRLAETAQQVDGHTYWFLAP